MCIDDQWTLSEELLVEMETFIDGSNIVLDVILRAVFTDEYAKNWFDEWRASQVTNDNIILIDTE